MDIKKSRDFSFNSILWMYLISVGLGLLLDILLFVFLLWGFEKTGFYIPANQVETKLNNNISSIKEMENIDSLIPEGASYILYSDTGVILDENMNDEEEEIAEDIFSSEDDIVYTKDGVYLRLIRDDESVCIIHYYVKAIYGIAWLNNHFIPVDALFFILAVLVILATIFLITMSGAKTMKKQIAPILQAVDCIAEQNLDFKMDRTRIKEVNQIIEGIDHMKNALQEALKKQWLVEQKRRDTISALAHDLKTPLAIIKGNAELLEKCGMNEDNAEFVETIVRNSGRMENYTKALIEINKADNILDIQKSEIYVKDFMEKIKEDALEITKVSGQQLELDIKEPDNNEKIVIDVEQLERAFNNIITNATQYSPEESSIRLKMYMKENTLTISVKDQGKGFSQEGLKKATEQFYRGDTSRHSDKNFGLGLYNAKRIVEKHGGSLNICNNEGEAGAEVSITI